MVQSLIAQMLRHAISNSFFAGCQKDLDSLIVDADPTRGKGGGEGGMGMRGWGGGGHPGVQRLQETHPKRLQE